MQPGDCHLVDDSHLNIVQPGPLSGGQDPLVEYDFIRRTIVIGGGSTAHPADIEWGRAIEHARRPCRRIDRPIVDLDIERIRSSVMPGTHEFPLSLTGPA